MSESTEITRNEVATQTITPAVDVFENKDEILLVADLAGVSNDALDLNLENGTLTLSGTWEQGSYRRVYTRSFAIPRTVDGTAIAADLKDGVLSVHLPKRAELKPRQITVRQG